MGFSSPPLAQKLRYLKTVQAMTTIITDFSTFPKNYLGTSWSRRDACVNIDVTMAIAFWQPCFFKNFLFFPLKQVFILFLTTELLYYT